LRQLSKDFTSKWHVNKVIRFQIKETCLKEAASYVDKVFE